MGCIFMYHNNNLQFQQKMIKAGKRIKFSHFGGKGGGGWGWLGRLADYSAARFEKKN
jgi:hypothetical protein